MFKKYVRIPTQSYLSKQAHYQLSCLPLQLSLSHPSPLKPSSVWIQPIQCLDSTHPGFGFNPSSDLIQPIQDLDSTHPVNDFKPSRVWIQPIQCLIQAIPYLDSVLGFNLQRLVFGFNPSSACIQPIQCLNSDPH